MMKNPLEHKIYIYIFHRNLNNIRMGKKIYFILDSFNPVEPSGTILLLRLIHDKFNGIGSDVF